MLSAYNYAPNVLASLGFLIPTITIYCTAKNIGGDKTLANYSISLQVFTNFHNFHNIPYANGLQFDKVFSAKLPTVLIHQSFLLYSIYIIYIYIVRKIVIQHEKTGLCAQEI